MTTVSFKTRLFFTVMLAGLIGLLYLAAVRDQAVTAPYRTTLTTDQAIECVAEHWAAGMSHISAVTTCAVLASITPDEMEAALP